MIQMVKSLSAVWETRIPSLGREDPLEKEMATRSSILFFFFWFFFLFFIFYFLFFQYIFFLFVVKKSHGQRSLAGYSSRG